MIPVVSRRLSLQLFGCFVSPNIINTKRQRHKMEGNGESHREGHDSFYGRMLIEEWEPLFQYQQQTPASYDDARPRIHAIASGATVKLVPKQWRWESVFQHLTIQNFSDDGEDDSAEAAAPPPNPDDSLIHCHPIDIWVTSRYGAEFNCHPQFSY